MLMLSRVAGGVIQGDDHKSSSSSEHRPSICPYGVATSGAAPNLGPLADFSWANLPRRDASDWASSTRSNTSSGCTNMCTCRYTKGMSSPPLDRATRPREAPRWFHNESLVQRWTLGNMRAVQRLAAVWSRPCCPQRRLDNDSQLHSIEGVRLIASATLLTVRTPDTPVTDPVPATHHMRGGLRGGLRKARAATQNRRRYVGHTNLGTVPKFVHVS